MWLRKEVVKSCRKNWICDGCFRAIEKGEPLEKHIHVWEGSIVTYVECDVCIAFTKYISKEELNEHYEFSIPLVEHEDYEEFAAEYAMQRMLE